MAQETEEADTVEVDGHTAACDGGGGALGHPTVYLPLGADGQVVCPYCSRRFVAGGEGEE